MAIKLAERSLPEIETLGVAVPSYRRSQLAPRILHLGVGGFHRSHMALYTDELAEQGDTIRGAGLPQVIEQWPPSSASRTTSTP